VKEIRAFWTEARKKIFAADDPQAEGEEQLRRWEALRSALDRADQAEEEARRAAVEPPQDEEPVEKRVIDWGRKAKRADVRAARRLRNLNRRLEGWLEERSA
jgi:hypothetical protein